MIEVDSEEESDLENDSDPQKVHTSSHIDPSKSNSQNFINSKVSKNFEKGN